MGVLRFYSFLKSSIFQGVILNRVPQPVNILALDANGLIHGAAQETYMYGTNDNAFFRRELAKVPASDLEKNHILKTTMKIEEVVKHYRPTDRLYIGIDGPVPVAKIMQQRQRRFRSTKERKPDVLIDTNCITPGTDFMCDLDKALTTWINGSRTKLPPYLVYMSHLTVGEGEHKIAEALRNDETIRNSTVVLYGKDADLVMISLLLPIEHIYIAREDYRDVIDISQLRQKLRQTMGTATAVEDFVFLCFMLGNDFLPHMPCTDDMHRAVSTMMEVYRELNKPITIGGNIHWAHLAQFLTRYQAHEKEFLEKIAFQTVAYPSWIHEMAVSQRVNMNSGQTEKTFDYRVFRNAWYNNAFKPKNKEYLTEEQVQTHYPVTPERVNEMCGHYMAGFAWVFTYYTRGLKALNTWWYYRFPYTPLLVDLAAFISDPKRITPYLPDALERRNIILNPLQQLLCVLPRSSAVIAPKSIQAFFDERTYFSTYMPLDFEIEVLHKNHLYEGIVLLPDLDIEFIVDITNELLGPELVKYNPVQPYVHVIAGYRLPQQPTPHHRHHARPATTPHHPRPHHGLYHQHNPVRHPNHQHQRQVVHPQNQGQTSNGKPYRKIFITRSNGPVIVKKQHLVINTTPVQVLEENQKQTFGQRLE